MFKKILCWIGIIWGSLIILNWLLSSSQGSEASQAGGFVALLLGGFMLVVSIINLRRLRKEE